jgi:protein phosphatase
MVSALFSARHSRIYIGHVGDSRCYRVRDGEVRLMTRDHSLINDYLLAMPELTEEQKGELPKNVITRALGMQDHVVVDLQADEPNVGDIYMLCSDGLSGMVTDEALLELMTKDTEPAELCRRLVEQANQNGGEDNVTAVVMCLVANDGPEAEDGEDEPVDAFETTAVINRPI